MRKYIKKLLREGLDAHELDKMLNSIKSTSCDCCKYFDMEDTARFTGLEHPIYSMIEKHQIEEIEYISPKQYLYNIANGFGLSYDDVLNSAYSDEKAKRYAEDMKKGDKFPIGYYKVNKADQEGRHRAVAAMILGCKQIPVVKKEEINRNYGHDFIEQYQTLDRPALDAMFKEKGYHGISDLDYRTFKNYIEFRL